MIQVDLVDYSRLTDLGMQITKYVNRNLKDIIRGMIDFENAKSHTNRCLA